MFKVSHSTLLVTAAALACAFACTKPQPDTDIHVTDVYFETESVTVGEGQSLQMSVTVLPTDATNKAVVWESEKPEIATVSSTGELTGVKAGTCVITATSVDGEITAPCKVTVEEGRKPVRPSGTGWSKVKAAAGVWMYTFSGTDPVSRQPQYVVVADIDTTINKLILFYDGNRHITSEVLSSQNGVVAMNGAYETASIFIKAGGTTRQKSLVDNIPDTTVPNWKNDGGIAVGKNGEVTFLNTIFREADSKGTGSYGETLKEQRNFYRGETSQYYSVYSSAPLLVWDYDPIGITFVPEEWSQSVLKQYDYEHPYRHQGWTHPRTAIGIDCDGHILMLVADGRYSGKAIGFSARNLTKFFVNNFDPRYALNMDGGGSTDMCVAGQGDATTHVVNHPCESGTWEEPGERQVTSFFCVVKK